jgi:hypothetical protein
LPYERDGVAWGKRTGRGRKGETEVETRRQESSKNALGSDLENPNAPGGGLKITGGTEVVEEEEELDAKALMVIGSQCPISVEGVIRGLR